MVRREVVHEIGEMPRRAGSAQVKQEVLRRRSAALHCAQEGKSIIFHRVTVDDLWPRKSRSRIRHDSMWRIGQICTSYQGTSRSSYQGRGRCSYQVHSSMFVSGHACRRAVMDFLSRAASAAVWGFCSEGDQLSVTIITASLGACRLQKLHVHSASSSESGMRGGWRAHLLRYRLHLGGEGVCCNPKTLRSCSSGHFAPIVRRKNIGCMNLW